MCLTGKLRRRIRVESITQQFEAIDYHLGFELRDELLNELKIMASNPILDEYLMSPEFEKEVNARAVERLFLESMKYIKSYESIAYVNTLGKEAIKVDRHGRVRSYDNISGTAFFQEIRDGYPGSIHFEAPHRNRSGAWSFLIGIHKTDADIGKFGGAVIIEYSLEEFLEYLGVIKIFDENPIWVFDAQGEILKQPSSAEAIFDPRPYMLPGPQSQPHLSQHASGMLIYRDFDIVYGKPLLRLAISIPAQLLLEDTRYVLRFFTLVFLAALLLTSLIAFYLSRYLSRPITQLADASARLAKGDLSTRVAVRTTGEVRMLVDSFNQMAQDLEKTTVSKDYLDNIISSMMDTLVVVSLDGKIMRANEAACFLLGYGEADLIGQPMDRLIADDPGGEHALSSVLEKGSVSTIERSYLTKSGKKVPVLFSASVMRDSRNIVQGVVCVAQDITERKQAEARLKAYSDELQEINEELKNFAYIVSHDLRAPLVNIKGFSEELISGIKEIGPLLEKYLEGFDEEERRKFGEILKKDIPEALSFIGSSVNRMDNLINAILKLSRAGRRKLKPEQIKTQELVQNVLNSLAHQIGNRRICVSTHELPDIIADRTALEQIVGNLLDNAIKYLDAERPGEIEISAEAEGGDTIMHVRDNGRGMAKEDIPKAFEVFRRIGKQDVPGEGMGLAYVKTLVRLHGGRIWCDSEPGVGSTFSFTLPQAGASDGEING